MLCRFFSRLAAHSELSSSWRRARIVATRASAQTAVVRIDGSDNADDEDNDDEEAVVDFADLRRLEVFLNFFLAIFVVRFF